MAASTSRMQNSPVWGAEPPSRGFPAGTRSLPVPAPLLGALLVEITDVAELKCTLRFLWYAAQVKGHPKAVPSAALESDDVLAAALGSAEEVRRGLALAVERGTLLRGHAGSLLLNTPAHQQAAASGTPALVASPPPEPLEYGEQPNIFVFYEDNIGQLTPLVADELRDAEQTYPAEWIEAAFREAVDHNKRSWRYISRVLERWAAEGRGPADAKDMGRQGKHGEPGRHPETVTAAEYLRRGRFSR